MQKVLIFNANNRTALTMARALGSHGVPVDGVGWPNRGVGLYSRYYGNKIRINNLEELTHDKFRQILAETKPHYIMAMGEEVLTHLNSYRSEPSSGTKFLFPEQRILDRAFDKAQTLKYARQVGLDCPNTYEVSAPQDIKQIAESVVYPILLKLPRSSGLSLPYQLQFEYRYVFDAAELRGMLSRYVDYGIYPLVQEYIPGKGVGVELCMYQGEMMAAFQHERIHEFPISGGPSIYRRSVALDPQLLEWSLALLRSMEWEGVAMVEYRRDPVTNRAALMEVNGRFWGSLPLAVKAGVNFPYILYKTMGEEELTKPEPYPLGVRVKQLAPHIKWLWHALVVRKNLPPEGFISRTRALWEFLCSLDPWVKFDLEALDDPVPGLVYWFEKLLSLKNGLKHLPSTTTKLAKSGKILE